MDTLTLSQVTGPDAAIVALLQAHFDLMRAAYPAESCHVMEPEAVFKDAAVVLAAHEADTLLGIGALKALEGTHGELKSMHTVAAGRGKGVGAAVLTALMEKARSVGMTHLSLETGSDDLFTPARALYAKHGFAECPPFGSYVSDPLSVFMTRSL